MAVVHVNWLLHNKSIGCCCLIAITCVAILTVLNYIALRYSVYVCRYTSILIDLGYFAADYFTIYLHYRCTDHEEIR